MALTDPVARSAARLAVLVAVPVAVLAGIGVFAILQTVSSDPPAPTPTAPTTTAAAPAATGAVEMAAPELTERATIVCRALLSQLPDELDGLAQRPVTAGPEQNAAFGDPPVTVSCGGQPAEVPPTGFLPTLSGVCWYWVEEPDATVWTTVDREVPVRVIVPGGSDGSAQRVVPLSETILETVRSAEEIPTGCRR
ncbi:MAG: DUF3515 family protein [Micromonosporaceae bacterium]|nr:DUF3515 family protein [Micromonosporaceae bacterium]